MAKPKPKGETIFDTRLGMERKKRLLTILMIFCICVLLILGTVAFLQRNLLLALADWLLAVHFTGNAIYLRKTGNLRAASWIGLVCLGGLFLFLLINGGVAYTGFVWTLIYPLLTIYLLGWKRGAIMTALVVVPFVIVRAFFPQLFSPGHPYTVSFMIRFVAATGVAAFVASYMDLSWREAQRLIEKKNELLQNLSHLDGLTGIYNRRHFDEEIEKQWSVVQRTGAPLSLLLLDVDHFKKYNDRYGHSAGDKALITVARALCQQASRRIDVVARYGGEEFGIILPGTGFGGAINVARRILQKITEVGLEHADGERGRLTASIGIACYDKRHKVTSPEELIKIADAALYQAKENGRNTFEPNPHGKGSVGPRSDSRRGKISSRRSAS